MHETTPARQDLSARLHQQLFEGQIGADEPGAVIAVYQDGTLLASACAGLADTAGGADLSPDTMMNVASISKQLAAAAVLIAARAGTVNLDADIRGLVPELQLSGGDAAQLLEPHRWPARLPRGGIHGRHARNRDSSP